MSLSVLAAAAEAPDRIALVVEGASLRYADLADRVRAAIGWLRHALGEPLPSRAALVAAPTLDALALFYALVELGVTVAPLHPRTTAIERQRIADALSPLTVLDASAPASRPTTPAPARAISPRVPDEHRDLAIVFTSGTSGSPKGVRLSRAALVAAARASAAVLGWNDDDRWLLCLPFAHVGGLSVLLRCLLARRTVVVAGDARAPFSPVAVLEAMARDRVTLASFVPAQLRQLLDARPGPPPPHLRAVLVGGAACAPALLAEAHARGWPALPTYGLTEACSQVATRRLGDGARAGKDCGPPLPGVEVRVEAGEIAVRGPTLFSGYLPDAAHPSPLSEDGWLRTGDAGFLDEAGRLHVLGRRDRLIVSGGENVAPVEVEQALEACPGVARAFVFGVPDDDWGQLVAAALVASGEPPGDADLLDRLAPSLSSFKRPRRIAWLPSLPSLPSGKVDPAATLAAAAPLLRALRR